MQSHRIKQALLLIIFFFTIFDSAIADPVSLRTDITLRSVATTHANCVRIDRSPSGTHLFYARQNGNIWEVDIATGDRTRIFFGVATGITSLLGFAVSSDSTFFVLGNVNSGSNTIGRLRKAEAPDYLWTTVVETEPYPRSSTAFDHFWNALAIDPNGEYIYINSGSRTDHGEIQSNNGAFPDIRETALTSAILRIPIDSENLVLPDNADSLAANGYLYADGVRNTFDLAFAGNGDLFGAENSGDRDDGDELNWIREGNHYGFPWRMGTNDTPQQFSDYDPNADNLIPRSSISWTSGFFTNDPNYPPPPADVVFTDPVLNSGPDDDKFRDAVDGLVKDASDGGTTVGSFTPHKSPLGLVFDRDSILVEAYRGGGFILGWTDSGSGLYGPFGLPGEDLAFMDLDYNAAEDRYEMTTERIVENFQLPIDAVMIDDKIYVLEFDFGSAQNIWEVSIPSTLTSIEDQPTISESFRLRQNYPNPFNPTTTIQYQLKQSGPVSLAIYNLTGQLVRTLVDEHQPSGSYSITFDASYLASGIYFYKLENEQGQSKVRKMVLMK